MQLSSVHVLQQYIIVQSHPRKTKYGNNTSILTPGALPLKSWDSLLPSMINKKQLHQQILSSVASAKQVLFFT